MRPEGCTNSPWVIVICVPRSPSISKRQRPVRLTPKSNTQIVSPNERTPTGSVSHVARTAGIDWAFSNGEGAATSTACAHAESSNPGRSQPGISLRAS